MASGEASSRPLGGTENGWWRAMPGGTGVSVLIFLPTGPISRPLLESAVRSLQSTHPILRSFLSASTPGQPTLTVASAPSATVRVVAASDVLPADPGPVSSFHTLLERELNQNAWAEQGPADPILYATIYEGVPEEGRSAVALRMHSSACDRASVGRVLKELVQLLAGGEKGTKEEPFHAALEDLIPKADTYKPFWARGKDMIGYGINGLRTSTLPFEDTVSGRRSEVARLVLSRDETQKLLSECKQRGVKLCGSIGAAAMIAARSSKQLESHQYETYSLVTLIDCRKNLDPPLNEQNLGNFQSAVINTHNIQGEENFWELAKRCHESYHTAVTNKKHLKDINDLNFLFLRAIDNPQLTPSASQRTALITVFEESAIHESSELPQELGVEDYIGCSSVHGIGPSLAVFDTIRDGKLDCALVYPAPLHSRKQIGDLVDHIKRILLGSEEE